MNWRAYDVPRMWTMIRNEVDDAAWQQVRGFENQAQLLMQHHDSTKLLCNRLANGWDPAIKPAAAKLFVFLDGLIDSMARDTVAHADAARGLDGVFDPAGVGARARPLVSARTPLPVLAAVADFTSAGCFTRG